MFRVYLLVLCLCCLGSNAWAMGQVPSSTSIEASLIGQPAPDINLPISDGTTGSVIAARQGGRAILVFWATWCPHCREELENIRQRQAEIEQEGIKIILVNVGESREEINAYLSHQEINLTSFIDEENALQEPYQLRGVPTVVLIDEKGVVLDIGYSVPANYLSIFTGV